MPRDGARPKGCDALVKDAAQFLLYAPRRLMRHHDAQIVEHTAQHHDSGDGEDGGCERLNRLPGEDCPDQPAKKPETQYAKADRNQADQGRPGDAAADPVGECPEPFFHVHDGPHSLQLLRIFSDYAEHLRSTFDKLEH